MSSKWAEALCVLGCIIGGGLTGYIIWKIKKTRQEKNSAKQYLREFALMCYGVAEDICCHVTLYQKDFYRAINVCIDMCSRCPEAEFYKEMAECFSSKNYLKFTYLVALNCLEPDDETRKALTNFRMFHDPFWHESVCEYKYVLRPEPQTHVVYPVVVVIVWILIFGALKLIFRF